MCRGVNMHLESLSDKDRKFIQFAMDNKLDFTPILLSEISRM